MTPKHYDVRLAVSCPECKDYVGIVTQRESGQEVYRTRAYRLPRQAEEDAYQWLYRRRVEEALEAFRAGPGAPHLHLFPRPDPEDP